jgi:dCTP diphosphatase
MGSIEELRQKIENFSKERDWDQFHSPKNLTMALSVEASELVEIFQWLTEAQSNDLNDEKIQAVADEIADVQIYLISLADKLGINILEAVESKIAKNEEKYPADKVRGSSKKYSEFD